MKKLAIKIKQNKKTVATVCVLVCAIGLLICGLSLAFFTQRDVVTNQHKASEISIELYEPAWQESGEEKAKKLTPDMIVEKDPYVYNDCEDSLYIRMQIVVLTYDSSSKKYVAQDSTSDIYKAIVAALYCGSSDSGTALLTSDSESTNSDFYLSSDGWFYYKNKDGLIKLEPGKSTSTLFDYMKTPVLKADYNGNFDTDFKIEIVAQAVSATVYTSETDAVAAFDNNYSQVTE
jgi:hypothetical protein